MIINVIIFIYWTDASLGLYFQCFNIPIPFDMYINGAQNQQSRSIVPNIQTASVQIPITNTNVLATSVVERLGK